MPEQVGRLISTLSTIMKTRRGKRCEIRGTLLQKNAKNFYRAGAVFAKRLACDYDPIACRGTL